MARTLLTLAEQSGFRRTGRTDEVDALCSAFAAQWPEAVRSIEFGRSGEGRPMRALIVSRAAPLSARELQARRIPVLLLQAGIHPGESDGKDAGFIALRELLEATAPRLLEQLAIVFVPAFNVDGHERIGRWNRPNQNGPEETGWRTTARNLNLNRDYTKADTVEMRAMLGLINDWDPLLCADLHVTDGADFQPDISIQVEPLNQGDAQLRASGRLLRDRLIDKLTAAEALPLPFYPDFVTADDPASGFVLTVYSPRFSTGYWPQRNRFTVLVETHSWKDYARRVRVTCSTIRALAELLACHGEQWLSEVQAADRAAARLAGCSVDLAYRSAWREPGSAEHHAASDAEGATMIDFPGYAYQRRRSAISGALVTVYDPGTPQIWRVPYRDRVEPSLSVQAPGGGYLVPAAYADEMAAKLAVHGIESQPLAATLEAHAMSAFRATGAEFSVAPFEGRMRVRLDGEWRAETRSLGAGGLYVPIAQARARLLLALLEPQAPDSLAAWGFFNACFEQKEQLEPYVAEAIAQRLLDEVPQLRADFWSKLRHDSAFAADGAARLQFLLRHHASWDQQYNLYPILRVDAVTWS
jgi:hypothetical protein